MNPFPANARLAQIWRRANSRYDWRYDYGAALLWVGGKHVLFQYGFEFKP